MMQIDEIALSEATVWRIVEEALNAQMLTAPHRVTGMDYDRAGETVRFDLELKAAPTDEVGHLVEAAPVVVVEPTRANGHAQQSAPENPKRRMTTDAQRQAIYEAIKADPKRTAASIAAEVGVSALTVAGYVTQYRKALAEVSGGNGGGNNRLEAGHSAEPMQAQFRPDTEDRPAVRVVRVDA